MGIATAAVDDLDVLRSLVDTPPVARDYTGFPWWHALLVPSNREDKSAARLARVHVHVYLPQFTRQVRCGGHVHLRKPKLCAVIAGMLFVPEEMVKQWLFRDDVREFTHVRGFIAAANGAPKRLSKADIEDIRGMEARLNLPLPARAAVLFHAGQGVRFINDVLAEKWGTGIVFELANGKRVGIEVRKLFGRPCKVYVPASEIAAM